MGDSDISPFLGKHVSVKLATGVRHEGSVADVDPVGQTISLVNVHTTEVNGRKHVQPVLIIDGGRITDLEIVETPAARSAKPFADPAIVGVGKPPGMPKPLLVMPQDILSSKSSGPKTPPARAAGSRRPGDSPVMAPAGAANNPTDTPRIFGLPRDHVQPNPEDLIPGMGGYVETRGGGGPRRRRGDRADKINGETFATEAPGQEVEDEFDFTSANQRFDKSDAWEKIKAGKDTGGAGTEVDAFDVASVRAEHQSLLKWSRKIEQRMGELCTRIECLDLQQLTDMETSLLNVLAHVQQAKEKVHAAAEPPRVAQTPPRRLQFRKKAAS